MVKNFDHLDFLLIVKLKDITFRKFSGVILHGLVDLFCLYPVQFGDIAVQNYLLTTQVDNFPFHIGN